jgi:hypothetical protein
MIMGPINGHRNPPVHIAINRIWMRLVGVIETTDRSIHHDLETKSQLFGTGKTDDPELADQLATYL